jgi:hypothetical protein
LSSSSTVPAATEVTGHWKRSAPRLLVQLKVFVGLSVLDRCVTVRLDRLDLCDVFELACRSFERTFIDSLKPCTERGWFRGRRHALDFFGLTTL